MTRPDLISELRSIQNTLTSECCGTLLDKTDLIGRLTTVIDQLDYRPDKRRVGGDDDCLYSENIC